MPSLTNTTQDEARTRFADAFAVRKDWDALLQRQWPVQLQPELAAVQEGIDYQTPDLEKSLHDHMDVLQMNPTVYDVVPLDQSPAAKAKARKILMWTARGWEAEDEGRWWDGAVAEGQVRHGYKVMRQMHRPQTDPPSAAGRTASTAEEVQDLSDAGKIEARNEGFKRKRHPFFWQDCDIYACSWLGDERDEYGPDVFFCEYEIPYLEARERFSGNIESLRQLGRSAWLGQGEVMDETQWTGKTVSVVVVDARDVASRKCKLPGCSHAQRVIRVYVGEDGSCIDDEHLVSEDDSPFPGCSFFVIGGRRSSQTDPNLRFRPLMHPLYVEANQLNYITTLELTEVRNDYSNNDLYLNAAGADPALLPEDKENHEVDFQAAAEGKIPWFGGKIERIPKTVSPHLQMLRQDHQKRLDSFKPNRFVIGQAYTEASNATGTAFIQQAQQAALPYNTLLAASDTAQLRSRRYEYHAIRFWAQGEPDGAKTRYYAVMTGDQGNVRVKGDAPKAGTVVYIDADMLDGFEFDLAIRTKSETLAEEGARWLQAKDQYQSGAIDPDQLMRAAGVDDIEGQKEKLEAARQAAVIEPEYEMLERQMTWRHFYGLTGINVDQFLGGPPPAQQGQQPRPQNGSAPPQGTGVVSPNNLMGRAMQQAVVSGPDGGGGPVAAGGPGQ